MKRFAAIAAIVFAAHSGLAWAQPVTVTSPDEMPLSRAERAAASDMAQPSPRGDECEAQQEFVDASLDASSHRALSYPSASLAMTLPSRWLNALRIGAGATVMESDKVASVGTPGGR
ncbi:hypothetical protein DWF00_02055 [Bosea caraganae]|uniref:Uncharacterized protein n=1 Tax=Bosea caraganae TaxID=2763117 RepID=A0A370KXB7_9HYPH|nr:hypothetical protein DWE98_28790 [Bosea caraganae]RDJ30489.1 hypothetical protein DWF00_02055 [Bosea caraganae]